jgi:hypothetical protein
MHLCYVIKQLLSLAILIFVFASCKISDDKVATKNGFKIILTDTTKNHRAQWDLYDFNYRSKLENQLGLSNLKDGADSLEIRLWYDFSFSNSQNLYTLKFIDTNCIVSYFRVYPRQINYDEENRNRNWDPYKDPIIDSSFSKTITVSKNKYQKLNLDSVWLLKSQSDLKISDSIGFTDCSSFIIEIADKKHLKYLRHHCSMSYYEKTKLNEFLVFEDFCGRITSLARDNNVYIEQKFDD